MQPPQPHQHQQHIIPPPSSSEGIINDGSTTNGLPTLDEPVSATLKRDLSDVWQKLKVVLLPLSQFPVGIQYANVSASGENEDDGTSASASSNSPSSKDKSAEEVLAKLRDWDLWGPLFVCLSLSVILSWSAAKEGAEVFAAVFMTVWLGSIIVTINGQLLGGTISFFQSLCVLGYCVFPLDLAALTIAILRIFGLNYTILDIGVVALGFIWATRASTVFIGQFIASDKRALAVYPVIFFYTFLAYLIVTL